jgi:hypothetical protein
VAIVVDIGVDVDDDVGDGQASTPLIVEEGDRCQEWIAPCPWASEKYARWQAVGLCC